MAHPTTAASAPHLQRREAIGDDPAPRSAFDEARSFVLGDYEPAALQASWADFQLHRSLPEDVENG